MSLALLFGMNIQTILYYIGMKMNRWGSFEDEDGLYKELETLRTFRMALRTWSDWIEAHVDSTRTTLFWVSMSPTHFW